MNLLGRAKHGFIPKFWISCIIIYEVMCYIRHWIRSHEICYSCNCILTRLIDSQPMHPLSFLDATSPIYKRVCPSIGPSIGRSIHPSVCRSVGLSRFHQKLRKLCISSRFFTPANKECWSRKKSKHYCFSLFSSTWRNNVFHFLMRKLRMSPAPMIPETKLIG